MNRPLPGSAWRILIGAICPPGPAIVASIDASGTPANDASRASTSREIASPGSGASGTVTATLTTLAPDSTVQIGLSLGTWNGSACSVQIDNASATQGAVISGTVSGAINLCVRIYDAAAKLTGPETYTITVVHP